MDVLKVGHHGSSTSSGEDFIRIVSPRYAAISVGEGNDYGHPSDEVLARLEQAGAAVSRTDRDGTIAVSYTHLRRRCSRTPKHWRRP